MTSIKNKRRGKKTSTDTENKRTGANGLFDKEGTFNNLTNAQFGLKNINTQDEEKISIKSEKKYFISLSSSTLADKNLNIIDSVVYGILKSCVYFSDKEGFKGRCFISIEEVANKINAGNRSVNRSLHRLNKNFWIAWKQGRDCSNEYLIFNKRQHDLLLGGCIDINKLWKSSKSF
jgi:hypothetical protein